MRYHFPDLGGVCLTKIKKDIVRYPFYFGLNVGLNHCYAGGAATGSLPAQGGRKNAGCRRQCAPVRPSFYKSEGQNTHSDQQIKKLTLVVGSLFKIRQKSLDLCLKM
jgi:hypothetical protein